MTQKKINLVELLKYCPKGMKLDCAMIDNVVFEKLDFSSSHHPIIIRRTDSDTTIALTKYGQYSNEEDYKCIIFPKGKTTWEGFVPPIEFKNGDIIYVKDGYNQEWCSILNNCEDGKLYSYADFCIGSNSFYCDKPNVLCMCKDITEQRLATEEEKERLFKAIKDNGYKWNEETKTLEKLIEPRFKVGDRVKSKTSQYEYTIAEIRKDDYIMHYATSKYGYPVPFYDEDKFELIPNKFDINTLQPFDRVLVRLTNNCVWMPKFFLHYDVGPNVKYYPFVTIDNIGYPQCIPYEGNEHLCRKTYDCDEFYKTWE